MDINNKVVLITGASSGIGRAVAIEIAKYNNKIVIVARREERLKEVKAEILKRGSSCEIYAGNALDQEFGEGVIRDVLNKYGKIDIAHLNIGIGPPSNAIEASAEKIKKCMRVNFESFINFYVPIIRHMKTRNEECLIAHTNSQASFFGIPMQGDYTASKGAVRLFIQTARMELKHFGIKHIRLQTIHPGFVDTEAVRDDGIPAPGEISEKRAAEYILKGFIKNKKENMFPFLTSLGVRVARRFLPECIITRVVLSQTPKNY